MLHFCSLSAFSPSQFDSALGKVVPFSVYVGLGGLAFAFASGLTDAVVNQSGVARKIFFTSSVLVYTAVAAFLFGISLVSKIFWISVMKHTYQT